MTAMLTAYCRRVPIRRKLMMVTMTTATVAVLLLDVLPKPFTGVPVSSVTVKLTTAGLLMLTLVTVTRSASAAHAAAAASLAGVALLRMVMTGPASDPGGPGGPGGPCVPGAPADPVSPLQPATTRAAMTIDTERRNELIMSASLVVDLMRATAPASRPHR